MTRARKWLLGIAVAIAAVVVVVVAALAWVLYTPSGLRFALDRGVAMMDGRFTCASASGTLAGEATLNGLHYRDDSGDRLRIDHATVDLEPWALLAGTLRVRSARIDGIDLALAPATQSEEPSTFSLEPPMDSVLDDVVLTDIKVTRSGEPLLLADSLALAGRWTRNALELTRLALRAPNGSVDLTGTLGYAHGYRGQGKATIDWRYQDTRYAAQVTSHSDGRTAHLQGTVTSPIRMQLDASLALDKQHAWTVDLHVPRFAASELPALPSAVETLALDLEGSGDAKGGKLTGSIVANGHKVLLDPLAFRYDGKALTLDPLRLRAADGPGVLTGNGIVHLDQDPIDVSLDVGWQDVQLPADLVGQKLATHGDVHVQGNAQRFAVNGALAIGPPGQLSNLQLDLAGTPKAIEINTLKLVQQGGSLDAHGRVGLQPRTSWRIEAVANDFNPGAILAGWKGAMDFKLATQGTLTPAGPEATFKLSDVGGTLRGRSIGGKADFAIHPGNLFEGSLRLMTGNSRIEVQGTRGQRTNAVINLDIASLNDWLPDASGSLHGTFHVTGSWPALGTRGELHGDGLAVSGNRIDKLELHLSVPDISKPGGDLDLALTGVHASGLDFGSVKLEGHGTQASHKLTLDARGEQLGLALTLAGGWNAKAHRWSGNLSDVQLTPHGLPAWGQQQPSAITWQRGALTLEQFCLSAGTPRLCVAGSRNGKGVTTVQYDLEQLPLQMFTSLMNTANPLRAAGDLSGSGKLAISNGTISGQANLAVGAGSIAYASNPERALLAWTGIEANLDAESGQLHLALQGNLSGGGHIAGDVRVGASEPRTLAGTVDVNLRSLATLEALSPEIANVQGSLVGQLTLGGTLAEPRFQGSIQTEGFSAELPRAGLELHDGTIAIVGDSQGNLRLDAQVTSGKGVLHITGTMGLAADAPLTLDIQGDNVLVADIPAAHVVASPDLHIGRGDGTFTISGSVTIPSAGIKLEQLPGQGPAQASPDVVIVDAPPEEKTAPMAVSGDVAVKLGDDVKLTGYGLDGQVEGSLAVHVQPGRVATGRGQISISGKYEAYGQNLTIERGRVMFAGTPLDNPGLDIRAVRHLRSEDVTVGLSIRGTATKPALTVFSDPVMAQAEALSYLVTGRSLDKLQSGEGNTLNTAAQALGGLAGDRIAKSVGSRLGLEAGVSSSEALGGSAFTAGKYLSPRLYLSYGVGLFTPGEVVTLRYTINRFLQFEAENASSGNRASLNYRIEK